MVRVGLKDFSAFKFPADQPANQPWGDICCINSPCPPLPLRDIRAAIDCIDAIIDFFQECFLIGRLKVVVPGRVFLRPNFLQQQKRSIGMRFVIYSEGPIEFWRQERVHAYRIRAESANIIEPANICICIIWKFCKIFPRFCQPHIHTAQEKRLPFMILCPQLDAIFYSPHIHAQRSRTSKRRFRPDFRAMLLRASENVMHERRIHFPEKVAVVVHGIVCEYALDSADSFHAVGGAGKLQIGKIACKIPACILTVLELEHCWKFLGQAKRFKLFLACSRQIKAVVRNLLHKRISSNPFKPVAIGNRLFDAELLSQEPIKLYLHAFWPQIFSLGEHFHISVFIEQDNTPPRVVPLLFFSCFPVSDYPIGHTTTLCEAFVVVANPASPGKPDKALEQCAVPGIRRRRCGIEFCNDCIPAPE